MYLQTFKLYYKVDTLGTDIKIIKVWEKAADAIQELAKVGDLVFPEQQQRQASNQQPHQLHVNQYQE